jgi:hypothetical protein
MRPSPFRAALLAVNVVLMALFTGMSEPHFAPVWVEVPLTLAIGCFAATVIWTNRRSA